MKKLKNYHFKITYEDYVKMQKDMSGSIIGNYSVEYFIAKGAFGKVYKGVNLQTKERVAIKLLDLYEIKRQISQQLLEKKLKLAKTEDIIMRLCQSPNLLTCFDVFQNEFLKLIVLQYCNDGNLEAFISDRGRISQEQAILILKQILNGISELHSHQIIHRDLKSENILIHNGLFKIADFGFSKKLSISNQHITEKHTILGTLRNMSPEVLNKENYGLKADIWSVGIILFQMIFGEYPFQSTDKKRLKQQIQNTQIFKRQRITFKNFTASVEISKLIKQMLTIQQSKRIGWRQLMVHPIFISKRSVISRSLILNFPLVEPKQLQYKQQDIQSMQDYNRFLERLNITEKDTPSELLSKFSYKSLNLQMKNQMTEEDKVFIWMNENLYECLKCELIYNQIVERIQSKQMLNIRRREVKEILYIILARCFLDMSPINLKMSKEKDKYPFVNQIYPTIAQLYQKIRKSFRIYCNILKTEQDKLLNRVKDWFTSSEYLTNIDKFLNGIQNQDYVKEQQIDFIEKHYIENLIHSIKGQEQESMVLHKYMRHYKEINMVDVKVLKNHNFDAYVQNIINQQ